MAKQIKTLDDIVSSIVSPSANISVAALQEAIAQRAEDRKKAVSALLVQMFESGEQTLKAQVAALRELRKQEKAMKANVDATSNALKFLGETGNPFPLLKINRALLHRVCSDLGMSVPDKDDPVWNVK